MAKKGQGRWMEWAESMGPPFLHGDNKTKDNMDRTPEGGGEDAKREQKEDPREQN